MKKLKENKGITLVALVITIIILLILAIVAINAVNGDGIIGKAKEARQNYTEAADEEKDEIIRQVGLIEDALGIEKPVEGEAIAASNGKAIRVGDLVYVISDEENKTATVVGDRGNIDYTNLSNIITSAAPTTSGDIVIDSRVKIGDNTYNVTSIPYSAFGSMAGSATNLNSVIIPNSITKIETGAFCGCTNLTNISIPQSVINFGPSAFDNTPWLAAQRESSPNKLVIVNNILIDAKTTNVTNLIVPDGVKGIGGGAFTGCTALTSIKIPSSVISIGELAFSGCTNITSITIPSGVTILNQGLFNSCSNLSNIYIESESITLVYDLSDPIFNPFASISRDATIYVRNANVRTFLLPLYSTISENYDWVAPTE